MTFEAQDVERKILSILKVLNDSHKPVGSRKIAQQLEDQGVNLSERTVRYHLRLMDERGLTELVGNRDGRTITSKGNTEIKQALVKDKVGFAINKIELLAFRTDFDLESRHGVIPVNVSLFSRSNFKRALLAMKPAFDSGPCVSQMVTSVDAGQRIGDIVVPEDKVGLVTVCSVVVDGALLKAGVPVDSRFSGILQMSNGKPKRFTEVIHYEGCSLDPAEIFIRAGMTSVKEAVATGSGEILANFRELPAICLPVVERVLEKLRNAGIGGVLARGNPSEPVCEVSVHQGKVGLVLAGGLNPVAMAREAGIEVENHSMSTVIDSGNLIKFAELLNEKH